MAFKLSNRSKSKLTTVEKSLVDVVNHAIVITSVDFTVLEGARTVERQRELVASGASRTMNSKHIPPRPGAYARAVDLGAYVGGELRWDWSLYYLIADAMRQSCIEKSIILRWGGVWDRKLNDLIGPTSQCVAQYVSRREVQGKEAFIDGPHFELSEEN